MSDATPAATVILLRETAGGSPELLLTQRAAKLSFAGGAMVFPGGKVEPGDAAVAATFDGVDPVCAAGRVAAAREAFEETGMLLTAGPPLDAATRADWRRRLNADAAGFDAFLAATGHRLDPAALTPFAHWVPPAAAPIARRFDTRFYLAVCPPGEAHAVDTTETVAAHWTTAAAALARGDIGLVFPTRRNLERLAQYASLSALLAAARARPPVRIQPAIEHRDGVAWLTIPEGCDYPITEERLDSVRRE